jgi:hypothetical protein
VTHEPSWDRETPDVLLRAGTYVHGMRRFHPLRRLAVVLSVGIILAALLGPEPAVAAGPPELTSVADFWAGETVVHGVNFTPGGQVAIYAYDPNLGSGLVLVGHARTTATPADYRCSSTGCRYYPGGEIEVHLFIFDDCWHLARMYAVDEASRTTTGWYERKQACP